VIFVDSSFWIGLAIPRDAWHAPASRLLERYGGTSLVTSNHVRGEAWTFLRRRAGHGVAVAFLDRLAGTARLEVELADERIEREALEWLRRHDERSYSFVDATSFALMRHLGIRDALAFDGDFAAAGFVELRPE
jgi:uncharacterized protein